MGSEPVKLSTKPNESSLKKANHIYKCIQRDIEILLRTSQAGVEVHKVHIIRGEMF